MPICNKCGEDKPATEFGSAKATKSVAYHANSTPKLKTTCKVCTAFIAKEWRKNNKNYRGSGRFSKYPKEDRKLISVICSKLSEARLRIKKFNKNPTDLDIDYLYELYKKQEGFCALTGVMMDTIKGSPLNMSLDQIEPNHGYVKGNIQWVIWAANRAKGDLNMESFVEMCRLVYERATTIP